MLIAEEYLLLTTDERGVDKAQLQGLGVAGALLSELAALEKVMLDQRGRLTVLDGTSTGDPTLDEALLRIGERSGRKPHDVLSHLGTGMRRRVQERLARAEIIQEDRATVLGIGLWRIWPLIDARPRDRAREDVLRVMTRAAEPDTRTGTLISLIEATSGWGAALPRDRRQGLSRSDLTRRAEEVARGRWGSEAVTRAVQEVAGAAAAVAVAAGDGGGGGGDG